VEGKKTSRVLQNGSMDEEEKRLRGIRTDRPERKAQEQETKDQWGLLAGTLIDAPVERGPIVPHPTDVWVDQGGEKKKNTGSDRICRGSSGPLKRRAPLHPPIVREREKKVKLGKPRETKLVWRTTKKKKKRPRKPLCRRARSKLLPETGGTKKRKNAGEKKNQNIPITDAKKEEEVGIVAKTEKIHDPCFVNKEKRKCQGENRSAGG